jgi:hypothetical protein
MGAKDDRSEPCNYFREYVGLNAEQIQSIGLRPLRIESGARADGASGLLPRAVKYRFLAK